MPRPLILFLALSMCAPAAFASAPSTAAVSEVQTFTVPQIRSAERFMISAGGTLIVEPDGSVSEVEIDMDEQSGASYREYIAGWRMHPVEIDGRIVRAKAHFRLQGFATVIPRTDKVQLGIDDVWFIDPPEQRRAAHRSSSPLKPPRYPMHAAEAAFGARVDLLLALDDEGRVMKAGVARMALVTDSIGRRGQAVRYANAFASAALSAAEDWVIAPEFTETAPMGPEGRTVIVPVQFSAPQRKSGGWQPRVPVDVSRPAWMLVGESQAVALTPSGEAPSTRFQLVNDVSGQILN